MAAVIMAVRLAPGRTVGGVLMSIPSLVGALNVIRMKAGPCAGRIVALLGAERSDAAIAAEIVARSFGDAQEAKSATVLVGVSVRSATMAPLLGLIWERTLPALM